MEQEKWLPVVGFEDSYEVSDLGRVRSVTRERPNKHKSTALIAGFYLIPMKNKSGHLSVKLYKNNSPKQKFIHTLVVESFVGVGLVKKGFVIDHVNNIPSDNRLENLQIITMSLNGRKDRSKGTSNYRWVYFDKTYNRWWFSINVQGKKVRSTRFKTEMEAHEFGVKWMLENDLEYLINETQK